MKNLKKILISLTFSLLFGATAFAQYETPKGLEDLIDMKAAYLDNELGMEGYTKVNSSTGGDSIYQFWYNSNKNKCITVRISDGRVASIVESPNDCSKNNKNYNNNNRNYNNNSNKVNVSDLVNKDAEYAIREMKNRGFNEVKKYSTNGKTYRLWYNGDTNQCIKTRSENKRIKSVEKSSECNL